MSSVCIVTHVIIEPLEVHCYEVCTIVIVRAHASVRKTIVYLADGRRDGGGVGWRWKTEATICH